MVYSEPKVDRRATKMCRKGGKVQFLKQILANNTSIKEKVVIIMDFAMATEILTSGS